MELSTLAMEFISTGHVSNFGNGIMNFGNGIINFGNGIYQYWTCFELWQWNYELWQWNYQRWQWNFRPAVNRQPMFPREITRRADSACPPKNSRSEISRLLQRTRSKNNGKHRFSMKIMIFGLTMKTLPPLGK